MNVGFIGLGTMGLPMARRLLATGHEVVAWDTDPAALDRLPGVDTGLDRMAQQCEAFITMLPEAKHVQAATETLLQACQTPGRLFIDCSSIDVGTTRRLATRMANAGQFFVDAPVSGGHEAASNGSLSFMIGGSAGGIEKAKPLLEAMGSRLVEFGESGSGQAAKACHNMICGITALGVCEAFALADALGLDLGQFHGLCRGAAAQSWILENRCPVPGPSPSSPASNEYQPGFAARLMAKDLGLAQRAAETSGQSTPFGAEAARRFREFVEDGNGDLDFSAIYRSIRF